MSMQRIKLPETLLNKIHQEIRFFSVILLMYDGDDSAAVPAAGTLCKIDDYYGIITAGHVWYHKKTKSGIKAHSDLKIVVGQKSQHISTQYLTAIGPSAAAKNVGREIPDIIFIIIPSGLHSTIEAASKVFYSLDLSMKEHGNDLFDSLDGFWCTFGSPIKRLDSKHRQAASVIYGTSTPKKNEEDGWDYLNLDIVAEENQMPKDAGGMSGGGIWRTRVLSDFSQHKVVFSGVNFFQTQISKQYQIIGHGPQSIYVHLLDLVRADSSNTNS